MKKLTYILAILMFCSVTPSFATTETFYATADTFIDDNNQTTNYGTVGTSWLGVYGGNDAMLIKFDLSSLAGDEVSSATLYIYEDVRGYQHDFTAYRLLRDWSETQATWNIYSTGNSWGTVGALNSSSDYTTSNSGSGSNQNGGWVSIDVTDILTDILASNDYGFIVRGSSGSVYDHLYAREGTYSPKLEVTHSGEYSGTNKTYYIRTDGGTDSQCTGLADSAYDGSGTGEACAYSHPYYALRVNGSYTAGLFQGGDTMIIGPGTYAMGAGTALTGAGSGSICNPTFSYDCVWQIPTGPDSDHPTRILGKGYDTESGEKPVLLGKGSIYRGIINLESGVDNIDIEWLDITDNAECIITNSTSNTTYSCYGSVKPSSDFARWGIWSINGSDNVTLKNLNIHGLSTGCIVFSSASNWTIDTVTCRGVGMVGWETDQRSYDADPSQSGTFTMTDSTIEYVGCAEDSLGEIIPGSCIGQADVPCSVSGYGDGMSFYGDAGAWTIDNLTCQYLMSDCYDSVHGNAGASTTIRNSKFIGLIGASVKGQVSVVIENSLFINDCAWPLYQNMLDPKYLAGGSCSGSMMFCRALNGIVLFAHTGSQHKLIGNTFFSNQDSDLTFYGTCSGTTKYWYLRNNIFYEGSNWLQDSTTASPYTHPSGSNVKTDAILVYSETCSYANNVDEDYNIFYNTKDGAGEAQGGHSSYQDPGLVGTIKSGPANTTGYFSSTNEASAFYLAVGSNARFENAGADTADETVSCSYSCAIDNNYYSRGSNWDTGALEYGSEPPLTDCTDDGGACTINGDCCGLYCCSNLCSSSPCAETPTTFFYGTLNGKFCL